MTVAVLPSENPFASRYVRPGALPYLFAAGDSASAVLDRFVAAGRRGAIVGPHGSGKSTLLSLLVQSLEERGATPIAYALHDGCRRLPQGFANRLTDASVLVIDGYEQLGWFGRRQVRRAVDAHGAGLLVTTHAPLRTPPMVYETTARAEVAVQLAERLLGPVDSQRIDAAEVRRLFSAEGGNLREVFFRLYDLYELGRV